MNAEYESLLALQARDSAIDQLSYQRDELPARRTLDELMHSAAALHGAVQSAQTDFDAAKAELDAAEAEVTKLEKRMAEINARLFGSEPISPKDAQAMTEELRHLEELKSNHETDALEKMEALEPRSDEVADLHARAQNLAHQIEQAKADVLAGEAALDEKLASERSARAEVEKSVPFELLARYDAMRPRLGGVAVAAVENGKCGGCHLSMSSSAIEELRKAESSKVITCEECGRMLAH